MSNIVKTAFISGHTDLSGEEFLLHYAKRLKEAVKKNHNFVMAGAHGADLLCLNYLIVVKKISPSRISIYLHEKYSDRFEILQSLGLKVYSGFSTHSGKDAMMTKYSDYDIAWLRPDEVARLRYGDNWKKGDISATEKNLIRRSMQM